MNSPLASAAGDAVEVAPTLPFLPSSGAEQRLEEAALALRRPECSSLCRRRRSDQGCWRARRCALDRGAAVEVSTGIVAHWHQQFVEGAEGLQQHQ